VLDTAQKESVLLPMDFRPGLVYHRDVALSITRNSATGLHCRPAQPLDRNGAMRVFQTPVSRQ
jgi:hypothetical protein